MNLKKKPKMIEKNKLVDNLLLITGFTSSGKFTFANLVDCIADVEHYQYYPLLEHLAALTKLNLIDSEIAKAMIQIEVDNSAYDLMVGRTVNFRFDDRSSIYKSPFLREYIQRGLDPDGDQAVEKIKSKKRYHGHIGHEIFPSIQMFLDMYPKIKILHLDRHPVDLIFSWHRRGWGRRFGFDLKDFSLPFKGINTPVPWFATSWPEVYEQSSEVDRVIRSIHYVTQMNKEVWLKLSPDSKSKIHSVCFEKVLTNPDQEIEKIGKFLEKEVLPEFQYVKLRGGLPEEDPVHTRRDKLTFLEENSSSEGFKMVRDLQQEYVKKWS